MFIVVGNNRTQRGSFVKSTRARRHSPASSKKAISPSLSLVSLSLFRLGSIASFSGSPSVFWFFSTLFSFSVTLQSFPLVTVVYRMLACVTEYRPPPSSFKADTLHNRAHSTTVDVQGGWKKKEVKKKEINNKNKTETNDIKLLHQYI